MSWKSPNRASLFEREAEVHDLDAPLDRPLECGGEGRALSLEVGAEDANGDDLRLRRETDDDAGAGRAVAEQVDGVVGDDRRLLPAQVDGKALDEPTVDGWMVALDAAVDDRDPYPAAGRTAPRPVPIDRPDDARYALLARDRAGRERLGPGGELVLLDLGGHRLSAGARACARCGWSLPDRRRPAGWR